MLLLGIDHTANTTIHLAESLSGVRYRRKYVTLLQNGQPTRFDYGEIDLLSELCPWWMAGWTPGVCSAWERRGTRAVAAGPLAGRGGGGDRAAAPG